MIMIHEFKTALKPDQVAWFNESQIDNYNNVSGEVVYIEKMVIVWQVELDVREWGIKSTVISVINFEFTMCQSDFTNPNTNDTFKGFEESFTNDETWKIGGEITNLYLSSCEIDFEDGTIDFY